LILAIKILSDFSEIYSNIKKNVFTDNYEYMRIALYFTDYSNYNYSKMDPFNISNIQNSRFYVAFVYQFIVLQSGYWVKITYYIIPIFHWIFVVGPILVLIWNLDLKYIWIVFLLLFGITYLNSWLIFSIIPTWIIGYLNILMFHAFSLKKSNIIHSIIPIITIFILSPSQFVIFLIPIIVTSIVLILINFPNFKSKINFSLVLCVLTSIIISFFFVLPMIMNHFFLSLDKYTQNVITPIWGSYNFFEMYSLEKVFIILSVLVLPQYVFFLKLTKFIENKEVKVRDFDGFIIFPYISYIFLLILITNFLKWVDLTKIPYSFYRYFIFLDYYYLILIPCFFIIFSKIIAIIITHLLLKLKGKFQKIKKNYRKIITNILLVIVLFQIVIFPYPDLFPERWKKNSFENQFQTDYFLRYHSYHIPSIMQEISGLIGPDKLVLFDFNILEDRAVDTYFHHLYLENKITSYRYLGFI
jgi:hypothetical protein